MMPTILVKPIAWLLNTRTYKKFARSILSGWTLRNYGYPTIKGSVYWTIKEAIEKEPDGLFVFCSVDKKMVSYKMEHLLSNCKYGHCGFVFKDPNHPVKAGELSIKHVNTKGFIYEPLQDALSRYDGFYVGKLPVGQVAEAKRRFALLERLCTADDFDYDFSMQLEPELISLVCDPLSEVPDNFKFTMYCSEFVYLIGKDLVNSEFKPTWFGDRYVFEPDDVYSGTEGIFEVY